MSRILLVFHSPLFAHSVRTVLDQHPAHTLVGEIEGGAPTEAEVKQLNPDVVIVEDTGGSTTGGLFRALEARLAAWRIIAMRLDDTRMHIWSGDWQPLTRSQDLIDALEV